MMAADDGLWSDATACARLFAVDPAGIGGVSLRAPPGPVRDRWLALLRAALPSPALRRIPLNVADGRLLGGVDLAATLRAGRPVAERGLLAQADGGVVVLAMAERLTAATAARLTMALDTGVITLARDGIERRESARLGMVALDEGIAPDERPPSGLLDRLGLHLDLGALAPADTDAPALPGCGAARDRLASVSAGDDILAALCATAAALGIASLRAPLLALRVARAAAALANRDTVSLDDAALAARLVLAPRATRVPDESPPQPPAPPEAPPDAPQPSGEDAAAPDGAPSAAAPGDLLLAAAQAAIPAGLLAQLALSAPGRARTAGRAGAAQSGGTRGRPVGVRAGDPGRGQRLNLIETLRAAAPWQRVRGGGTGAGIRVRREDFRITRLRQRSETTTIFVVDASGSSALNRLAEAKGAVELLLAESYVRRDRVAVLAFRNRAAELLLPPTRSLVRAKRSLAGLPGGGATPLAAGIEAAFLLADAARRRGETPTLVLLTDGRANIGRDGKPGRAQAEQDCLAAARQLRAARLAALVVDTSPRPHPFARQLAHAMAASYLPLPVMRADSLSLAVRAARDFRPAVTAPPSWERDGRDWPNRNASRFVSAAGLSWHVQVLGAGPALLLAHGTGAATHSWRRLAPLLAQHFTVVAPDLPGHGFTATPPTRQLSLPGMADALGALLRALDVRPELAVGHSAGAAILARMCLDHTIMPRGLVSLNGALLPLYGLPGKVFAPLARVLAGLPLVPQVFAWHAGERSVVERLLRDTGSTLEAEGVALYARLAGNPVHAAAALGMMANWDLEPLFADLPQLEPKLLMIVGGNDRTISPADAQRVRAVVPTAQIVTQRGLGHLAHEEAPDATATTILEFWRRLAL